MHFITAHNFVLFLVIQIYINFYGVCSSSVKKIILA